MEIAQTWDNPRFEEIDLDRTVQASPTYLVAKNFMCMPDDTLAKMRNG